MTKVAHADAPISGVNWSADAATLTYTVGAGPGAGPTQHQTIRPEIGSKLIFVAYEGGRGGGTGGQAFTVPAGGGTPAPVTAGGGRGGGRAGAAGGGGGRGGGGNQIGDARVSTRTSNRQDTNDRVDRHGDWHRDAVARRDTDRFFSAVNRDECDVAESQVAAVHRRHDWVGSDLRDVGVRRAVTQLTRRLATTGGRVVAR